MTLLMDSCRFNLPRWEFSELPLSPAKVAYGMAASRLGYVAIEQKGENAFYALGLSDQTSDIGKYSAVVAFYFYCLDQQKQNALAMLDLGGGKIWLAGLVKGKLWPSSDSFIQPQEVDYHLTLFADVIDEDQAISLFISPSLSRETLFSDWQEKQDCDFNQVESQAFIQLIQPDERSRIKKVKTGVFTLSRLIILITLLLAIYFAIDLWTAKQKTLAVDNTNWSGAKTAMPKLQKEQIDRRKQIERLIKQEMIWLQERSKASENSSELLEELHQILTQQALNIAAWDLKLARYQRQKGQKVIFQYQRSPIGQAQDFIDQASLADYQYQMDKQGNLASVEHLIAVEAQYATSHQANTSSQESAINLDEQPQNTLPLFNQRGEDYFTVLSRIQAFCYAWQTKVKCETKKPMTALRNKKLSAAELNTTPLSSDRSLLLVYQILNTKLSVKELNSLLQVANAILADNEITLVKQLDYNFTSKDWQLSLETHTKIIKNLAKKHLRETP